MPADRGGSVAAGRASRPVAIHLPPAPRVQPNPDQQIQAPRPRGAPPSHTDITSSGPGYGSARANAYKQTAGYRQAVAQVFTHQPPAQKARIVQGLTRFAQANNAWHMPEFQAVRGIWDHLSTGEQNKIATYIPKDIGNFIGAHSTNLLNAAEQGVGGLAHMLDVFRSSTTLPGTGTKNIASVEGGNIGNQFAKGISSDAANLFGAPLTTLAMTAQDIGHPGKLASDFFGFPVRLGKDIVTGNTQDLGKQFIQHPLFTVLVGRGAVAGATRLGAAPIRALASPESKLGRAVSTARPGVWLTGNLTHERPPFSKAPSVKAEQKATERALYKEGGPGGTLLPRSDQQRKRLMSSAIGGVVGLGERLRRVGQEQLKHEHMKSVRPSAAKVVAHAAKSALAYGPEHATVPGGDVMSLIQDATVRRPETYTEDLAKYRAFIGQHRGELVASGNKQAVDVHDALVNLLNHEIEAKRTPKQLKPIFDAVKKDAATFTPLEAQEHALGHFGADMPKEGLLKRTLTHYAMLHMGAERIEEPVKMAAYEKLKASVDEDHPGWSFGQKMAFLRRQKPIPQLMLSKFNTRTGAMNDPLAAAREIVLRDKEAKVAAMIRGAKTPGEKKAAQRAARTMVARIQELRSSANTIPLSNEAIIAHMNGPEGTGGRMPIYTSDAAHPDLRPDDRSSYYVKDRPVPKTNANPYEHYRQGLINPGQTALLERKLEAQGVIDAHGVKNQLVNHLVMTLPKEAGGGYADTYSKAQAAAPRGYVPINIAQTFHPLDALDQALKGTDPATVEQEAQLRALDLKALTKPTGDGRGRWGIIDKHALKVLEDHEKNISPDILTRSFRSLNNQFRTVVLSTSAKHVPGVMFENLIRDVGYGVGFRSWVSGHAALRYIKRSSPDQYRGIRTHLTGGQQAGMALQGRVYHVSDHWEGTSAYPMLKGMEAFFKTPGPRQARAAWQAWSNFAIKGTKKMLEEQHQIAGLGKGLLQEHGYAEAARLEGFVGVFNRALGLHGRMVEEAARGLYDPAKQKQMRALINRMYGKWTDFSPAGQRALMYSPFGLWWVNSARFLAHMPVDMPVKTALLASATAATQQRRQAIGMDFLSPGALPGYEMGGIPAGDKIIAQNYYSPFGMVNDPKTTAASLFEPWLVPVIQGFGGQNYLWKPLSSPDNPRGAKKATGAQEVQYVLNSALASFLPLYSVAGRVMQGGQSAYDVTNKGGLPTPKLPTKKPGSLGAGFGKVFLPVREYKKVAPQLSGGGSGIFGGSGGGSSSGDVYIPGGLGGSGGGGGGGGGGVYIP